MKKMLDSVTDGPKHPDEEADYLGDTIVSIARPFGKPMECPECNEIALILSRIDQGIEEWGCINCGTQVNF